jgi:hypothetical protein
MGGPGSTARARALGKRGWLCLFPIVGLLAGCRSRDAMPIPEAFADEAPTMEKAQGVAVVELFTSEGCSSCPPADAVLAEISRAAKDSGRAVYALELHVDYWDSLGWPDRFASPDYSERQRDYARAFGTSGVYTPQMIVDGREQFVGSDSTRAAESISRALSRPATARVTLRVRASGANALSVDYQVTGAPAGARLNLAVVERAASVVVKGGENAGRTLRHTDLARSLAVAKLIAPSGTEVLNLPPDLPREGSQVIAFVQRGPSDGPDGMAVLGASRASLAQ